jgi:hypothetical protein
MKSRTVTANDPYNKKKNLFTSNLDLNLKKKLVKYYIRSMAFYGEEIGHFEQKIRNTGKILKCGAGEGWRRSVGPIM